MLVLWSTTLFISTSSLIFIKIRYKRTLNKYRNLIKIISTFLNKDDNFHKYHKECFIYMEIISGMKLNNWFITKGILKITEDLNKIKYNNISYTSKYEITIEMKNKISTLYELFKNIVPELIAEERNKKIKEVL